MFPINHDEALAVAAVARLSATRSVTLHRPDERELLEVRPKDPRADNEALVFVRSDGQVYRVIDEFEAVEARAEPLRANAWKMGMLLPIPFGLDDRTASSLVDELADIAAGPRSTIDRAARDRMRSLLDELDRRERS